MPLSRLRLSVLPEMFAVFVILEAILGAPSAFGAVAATQPTETDWPQFLGPNRNAVTEGAALASQWPEKGQIGRASCRERV